MSLESLTATKRLAAKYVPTTPSCAWPLLALATGADVWAKHENHAHRSVQSARRAQLLVAPHRRTAVPPFHPWLVEGVATYGTELHEQVPGLEAVYVPVGMGSGISANIAVRDLLGLDCEIVGVVADPAPARALSYAAGQVVATETAGTFVDGVACRVPDPGAVANVVAGCSRIVRISEAEAAAAMVLLYRATRDLAEPAGSLSLAAVLAERERVSGRKVAMILTGGNCDLDVPEAAAGR